MRPVKTYPHPRVIAIDTITAGVMARASLNMARRAMEKATQASEEYLYTRAAGLTQVSTDCVMNGLAAALFGKEMAQDHQHEPECLIEKCQVQTGLSILEEVHGQLEMAEREAYDLGLNIDNKNRIAPLEDRQVHRHGDVAQYHVRLEELREMTAAFGDENAGLEWSAREKDARIRIAEWVCLATNMGGLPDQVHLIRLVDFQNPDGEDMHREDSEEYRAQSDEATQAQEEMLRLIEPVIRNHTGPMPLFQSTEVQKAQQMTRTTDPGPQWMTVPEVTVFYNTEASVKSRHRAGSRNPDETDQGETDQGETEQDDTDPDETEPLNFLTVTQFVHQGRRIEKTISDPYPKDFPQDVALSHIASAREALMEMRNQDQADLPSMAVDLLLIELSQAEGRALNGFQSVSKSDIQGVLQAARDRGASKGMAADMIEGMMTHDSRIAGAVLQDGDQWMQTMTKDQVRSMVRHGRGIGLDEHTLRRMAGAMGYSEKQAGIQAPVLDNEAIEEITSQALDAGIPQDAVNHMEEWLRS